MRDCVVKEQDLINRAVELKQSVVAITDHETIASAVNVEKIYKKLKEKEVPIKVIMGNEIYLCRDGLSNENFVAGQDKYYHFILLAKDLKGYQQICELSTRAWLRSYMGRGLRRVPTYYQDLVDIVGADPGHLIGSSACLGGMVATQLLKYKENPNEELWNKILNWCRSINNIFGNKHFYLELQPSASKEQTYVNQKLVEISKILNIPYIITCDTHYLKKEDRNIHKAYLNAQDGDREIDAFYATTYLMDTEELEEHLDLSEQEILTAYQNIAQIQDMCEDYSILKPLKIPSLKWNEYKVEITQEWFDKIPMFETFVNSDFEGDKELVKAIIQGINNHEDLQNEAAYQELNSNLEMTWISSNVNKAHWSAYFLNLQKILDLCWDAGTLVGPGRGSGVGFLLLYALGITQINPLREETRTFAWRFLNPDRVSVLDIDSDIESNRRGQVLQKFREFYGEDRVANVTTLRTEKSKSAILTAARGLGIEISEAQYLASLVPADRGQIRSLQETYYGDKEKGTKPVTSFVNAIKEGYEEVWEVAQKIEGLICGTGIHAGGVIFVDEPFTNSTGLMRAPDGTICTQFDLHTAEDVSLIKFDMLSIDALDKIHVCLDLLCEEKYIPRKATLKETYENAIGIYKIERNEPKMWKMIHNHEILSLFQMEEQSGIQGINLIKPVSVNELCVLNSVIRLMAPDKNSETPLETWAKYRKDKKLWLQEMKEYGLTQEEIIWLGSHSAVTDGICESQEGLMSLLQESRLGSNSLNFADKVRKAIAKKVGGLFQECEQEFYANIEEKGCSKKLAHYVWDILFRVQRGYSFNRSHTLAYSLVGLQEMNLAYTYPTIFWNTACLITNSGSLEEPTAAMEIVNIYEKEDTENYTYIDLPDRSGKKKVEKNSDYTKMAKALGEIVQQGITVSLIDINNSGYSFKPDVKNNEILFGLKALSGVNSDIIKTIIDNRPYVSFTDFLNRCSLNKTAMVSLIKSGAFDNLELEWAKELNVHPRYLIMVYYLFKISEPKTKLTLQNFSSLVKKNLVPGTLDFQKRVFNFNKYLKSYAKSGKYYVFNDSCLRFFESYFNTEVLEVVNGCSCVLQTKWDKIYQAQMDEVRSWLKEHQEETLKAFNTALFMEQWEKYAQGNLSAWEMESLCFYYHDHELKNINKRKYGIANFFKLSPESEITTFFRRGGVQIPIYATYRIIGTVIGKNDVKATISLLTTNGVVSVKFTKEYYAMYARQISEIQPDGTKKVVEKSWFTRGTKLMITGYRRDDQFVAKSYASTGTHQLYKITKMFNEGQDMELTHDRAQTNKEEY